MDGDVMDTQKVRGCISIDYFITRLVNNFGLTPTEDDSSTKTKNINDPYSLIKRIHVLIDKLANHLFPGENNNFAREQLIFTLGFTNVILLFFNRVIPLNHFDSDVIYKTFERDVLMRVLVFGLCSTRDKAIKSKITPALDDKTKIRLQRLIEMLDIEYIANAKDNIINTMTSLNKNLKHGVGGDIKRYVSKLKNEKTIKSIGSINLLCENLEQDRKSSRSNAYESYPETETIRSLFYISIAAQHFQREIDPSNVKIDEFNKLAAECIKLFDEWMRYANFSASNSYQRVLQETDIVFTSLEKSFIDCSIGISDLLKDGRQLNKCLSDYDELINLIQRGNLEEALTFSDVLLADARGTATGWQYNIVNKINIALTIKINPTENYTPYRFASKITKSMLLGSSGFSCAKGADAFHFIPNGILSDPSSLFILSSIQTLNEIIDDSESLNQQKKQKNMIIFLEQIDKRLEMIYSEIDSENNISSAINIKEHYSLNETTLCIPFIKESNLFNCLSELNSLIQFFPTSILCTYPSVIRFCNEPTKNNRMILHRLSNSRYAYLAQLNASMTISTDFNVIDKKLSMELKCNPDLDEDYLISTTMKRTQDFFKFSLVPHRVHN